MSIKKLLLIVLAVQLVLILLVGLAVTGIYTSPILRQVVGFVYLSTIPGLLILRVLRIHNLGVVESLLYAVGLSLFSLMFLGFFINVLLPAFGIPDPFSLIPLAASITVIVIVLSIVAYLRDRFYFSPKSAYPMSMPTPGAVALCLLPLLSIFGTSVMNFYDYNVPLLALLFIVAVLPVIFVSTGRISGQLYPLAIFVMSISLLYHTSLISMHLWGRDIHVEYYFAQLTQSGYWDSSIGHDYNGMLSAAVLPSIYSTILDMDLVWVFKIVYPLLFSLVPVCLFQVFKRQVGIKVAFLAAFLFMTLTAFMFDMPQVARMEIAMLLLVLMVLTLVLTEIRRLQTTILFLMLMFSLVVSHYGLSYIFMFLLFVAWLILTLMNNLKIQKFLMYLRLGNLVDLLSEKTEGKLRHTESMTKRVSSLNFVLLFMVIALVWYMYVSGGTAFGTITIMGEQIVSNITDLFDPEKSVAFYLTTTGYSGLPGVKKGLNLATEIFIVIGVLDLVFGQRVRRFNREYLALSFAGLILLFAAIVLPFLSGLMSPERLYHTSLILLAPFCVRGGMVIFEYLAEIPRLIRIKVRSKDWAIVPVSVIIGIYLLFNTGLAYELGNEKPVSFALNSEVYPPHWVFSEAEFDGAQWLVGRTDNPQIYAGHYERVILYEFVYLHGVGRFEYSTAEVPAGAYLYLGQTNTKYGQVAELERPEAYFFTTVARNLGDSTFYNKVVLPSSKIYSNGDVDIYRR